MDFYTQRIIVKQQLSERLQAAENERLARRPKVHRDGSVSFTRKFTSAAVGGAALVAAAVRRTGATSPTGGNGLARA